MWHEWGSRYGNCFKTNLFGGTHVFISSTESSKRVLSNESAGRFTKKYLRSIAKLVGPESLLCASHEKQHKLLRSHFNPLFSTNSLSLLVTQFDQLVLQNLATWKHQSSIIVLHQALKVNSFSSSSSFFIYLSVSNSYFKCRFNIIWTASNSLLKKAFFIDNIRIRDLSYEEFHSKFIIK